MARRAASNQALVPFKRGPGLTTAERSRLMGRVRHSKTAPEQAVAAWLRANHLAYRCNVRALPGRPDFANRRAGFAIFVHGCYWHRHPGCARTTTPIRNRGFWLEKFAANVARDAARSAELEGSGLLTFVVWECETEKGSTLDEKLGPLLKTTPARAKTVSANPSGERTTFVTARGARAFVWAGTEGVGS